MVRGEVVGEAGLRMDVASWPYKFIEAVLTPAVYGPDLSGIILVRTNSISTNLYRSDGSVKSSAFQVEEDYIRPVPVVSMFAIRHYQFTVTFQYTKSLKL